VDVCPAVIVLSFHYLLLLPFHSFLTVFLWGGQGKGIEMMIYIFHEINMSHLRMRDLHDRDVNH
jgi:hypothetical protein